MDNTVRIGNINYLFWTQHSEWVASLRTEARFEALMVEVKRKWISITLNADPI